MLHLKRFEMGKWAAACAYTFGRLVVDVADAGYMQASKLKQHVAFEETLDLGPFMRRRTQQQQQQQPRHMYQLCGVVVHDGSSVRSGHYYR